MISTHEGRTDGLAGELGYDSQALEALQTHYEALIASGTLQGASYLIARKGQVIARRSLGSLNHSPDSPGLKPDSIRKTYSITKAFTSVAIGQLIDRGLLHLHQSAGTILPEMDTSKHREITIFQLLTHTSGLRGDPGFHNEPYPYPWFERVIREYCNDKYGVSWIQSILAGPLQVMPGKEWIYSTSAYALLGAIISKVSGKTYEAYIREEILEPLGMDRSFFAVPEELWSDVCVTSDWEIEALQFSIKPREEAPPKSGNGLYSTLDDLWKFGQMMLNGGHLDGKRILSARAVEVMTSNHLTSTAHKGWGSRHSDYPFGLGWSLEHYDLCSEGTFSHEGFGHCGLFVDPAEEMVFAFFVPSVKGFSNESVLMPRAIVWSGLQAKSEVSLHDPDAPHRVTPEDAGYEAESIVRLEAHFERLIQGNQVQCASYLLSRDGEVFAAGANGSLRHDDPAGKLELNSIRRIASITKLFTAVAIFQLVEQGKLFLRQPVTEWIEEFKHPMYEKINVMQLLNHTSGLPADGGYYLEPYPASWWAVLFSYQPETEGPWAVTDPEELEKQRRSAWIRAVLGGKPVSEPGAEWSYSTAGYAILGEIIARASGKTYEQYMMEHIVEPLGMTRTFFDVPEGLRHEVCLVADYEKERLTEQRSDNDKKYFPPPSGGGLYSTLPDLFRFGQMLLNGGSLGGVKILSRKSVEKMSANSLEPGVFAFDWGGKCGSKKYGIGPSLIGAGEWQPEGSYGHEGAGRSKLVLDPARNSVMAYFVPSTSDWSPESVIGTLNIMGAGWR
ncbi:serine hydrolase domain-containing protein [Paenibacillus sp. CAU 1782]